MVTSKITKTTTTELGIDIKVSDVLALVEPTISQLFGLGTPNAKKPHIEFSIQWNTEREEEDPKPTDVIAHVRAILVVNE